MAGPLGCSRVQRPRNCQILVGIVMMGGGPSLIVLRRNRLDQTTVKEVAGGLRQRFGLNRLMLVGDRGIVTLRNLKRPRLFGQW